MTLEKFVFQALTALECRYQPTQVETAVWEQMTASHMVLQETVTNALVSLAIIQNWQVEAIEMITKLVRIVSLNDSPSFMLRPRTMWLE